jgi:hypothetical protein
LGKSVSIALHNLAQVARAGRGVAFLPLRLADTVVVTRQFLNFRYLFVVNPEPGQIRNFFAFADPH